MATAELIFPKVGNDPLFNSEINGFSRNNANGITPTISGFNTNPTNLSNSTDSDLTTATGEGFAQDGGIYIIKWDLGDNRLRESLFIKYGHRETDLTGGTDTTIEVSENDSDWTILITDAVPNTTETIELSSSDTKIPYRYVRAKAES
ncbi:MAG: hypothetical protein IIB16_07790, partial [Chloroflexi bacterium]|nr:hypothetical protein [Chloroflexota bacterium]